MNDLNPICVNDGETFDSDKLEVFQINELLRSTNGTVTINFVGVVMSKDNVLLSFPKHFDYNKLSIDERKEYIKSISSLLVNGKSTTNPPKKKKHSSHEFPMDSYIVVVDYFKKYGIYNKKIKVENKTNSGKPNWKKTMKKSSKIVQENGIVFLPIISTKNKNRSVFLSDCMEFILSNTYEQYSEFLNFLIPYQKFPTDSIFKNFRACVRKLKLIKNHYFKDSEKDLISAMISYFEWMSSRNGTMAITTSNFSAYWESMIHVLLNKQFVGIKNNNLVFGDKPEFKFLKKTERTEAKENREYSKTQKFSIEFDHISINDEKDKIILFDSKYMNKIKDLNYKQAFYYYFLKAKYPYAKIHNGLIAPTEGKDKSEVHIDRSWINGITKEPGYSDGLKIIVHYLNLKKIIDFTLSNIHEFKKEMRERSKSK